jgi:hypothetical protein
VSLLLTFVVVGVLFGLVALRRGQARRWQSQPERDSLPRSARFDRVWMQVTPPRPSFFSYRQRAVATLVVDPERRSVVFEDRRGEPRTISNIWHVVFGPGGNDFVNTWIRLDCDPSSEIPTVYLNDGAWLGWRAMLTSSNRRIADAMRPLSTERPE